MKTKALHREGSTLVVTITVVATLLVLLAVAVDYTTQISRSGQRSRKTALAMEIADGHLETLFTNWRNIYRTSWSTVANDPNGTKDKSLSGTNFFYTAMYSPAPAPTPLQTMNPAATPPTIPLPSPSNFPTSNYTVSQYRIQAVDPMITLDSNENALVEGGSEKKGNSSSYGPLSPAQVPPEAYGPNTKQKSYFYLAATDVSVPAVTGNVTAKVRRVFEKKFDQPWTYAMFYVDDLELQPSLPFTITGPIHTNSSLYIGTSNFSAGGLVEYGTDYVNGYSPKDGQHTGTPTVPNFAKSDPTLALSDCPPSQVSPYLPFGWNLSLNSTSTNGNDDGYHEIVETAISGMIDPLKYVRYSLQPGYQVVIAPNTTPTGNGTYTVTTVATATDANPSPTPASVGGTTLTKLVGNSGNGGSTTVFNQGRALFDAREGAAVRVTDVDIVNLINNLPSSGWTGVLYLADKGATIYNADGTVKTAGTAATVTIGAVNGVGGTTYSTTRRAFRIINGHALPGPLTIVSENPLYIQGNFNTSTNPGDSVASNNGTYTDPDASGYTRLPAAIIADAITVLSPGWKDASSNGGITSRVASAVITAPTVPTANTTINAALVSGNVPSNGTSYSGGGENFIRLLEDWSGKTFCYYGSMVQLYRSNQAIGPWNGDAATVYRAPATTRWYYDGTFSVSSPPGNLQIAAYLQQQRWYQVY